MSGIDQPCAVSYRACLLFEKFSLWEKVDRNVSVVSLKDLTPSGVYTLNYFKSTLIPFFFKNNKKTTLLYISTILIMRCDALYCKELLGTVMNFLSFPESLPVVIELKTSVGESALVSDLLLTTPSQ